MGRRTPRIVSVLLVRFQPRERTRLVAFILVMALITGTLVAAALVSGYRLALDDHRADLMALATSRARLVETLPATSADVQASLPDFFREHEPTVEIGGTTEVTLATIRGDSIVFLLVQRGSSVTASPPFSIRSPYAEPMRKALSGQSGVMVGRDYRGMRVLAAYEPVDAGWRAGVVAKIDLAEIRGPYMRAGLVLGGIALALIGVGAAILIRVGGRYQRSLSEGEEQLRDLYEHSPDSHFSVDLATGTVSACNRTLLEFLGCDRDEVVGKPVSDLYQPTSAADAARAHRTIAAAGEVHDVELSARRKNGATCWISLAGRALHDEMGNARALRVSWRDITERKQAEEGLRHERERAEHFLDVAAVMIIALDARGVVTLINRKGCDILGGASADIVGRNWFEHFVPADQRDEVKDVFGHLMAGDLPPLKDYENEVLRLDGGKRLIAWRNSLLRDAAGLIVGVLSSGADVTERRRLERDALMVAERERERIGQDLHDVLGQQLTAANLMLGVMERTLRLGTAPTPQQLLEIRTLIEVSLAHVRFISHGFLPIAGGENGLNDALADLAANSRKLFGISCVAPADDSPTVADSRVCTHLYHIAQEAITNAIRHGGATSVVLELEQSNEHLVLRIVDDGSGVPDLSHVDGGRGIQIMRTRAAMIGASLTVTPGPANGTVVCCTLPSRPRGRRRHGPQAS